MLAWGGCYQKHIHNPDFSSKVSSVQGEGISNLPVMVSYVKTARFFKKLCLLPNWSSSSWTCTPHLGSRSNIYSYPGTFSPNAYRFLSSSPPGWKYQYHVTHTSHGWNMHMFMYTHYTYVGTTSNLQVSRKFEALFPAIGHCMHICISSYFHPVKTPSGVRFYAWEMYVYIHIRT